MTTITTLHTLHRRAANPAESVSAVAQAVEAVFDGLSAEERKNLCREFGIVSRPKSGVHAVHLVKQRIVERLESAQRCQF